MTDLKRIYFQQSSLVCILLFSYLLLVISVFISLLILEDFILTFSFIKTNNYI